jgi:hypothetical protein
VSKRFPAALAADFESFLLRRLQLLTAPVTSIVAASESRQSPIRIKQGAMLCPRPGGQAAPEERWCRFASNGFHRLVAAD